jgi:hypothetical protein
VGAGTNAVATTPASSNLQHQFFPIMFMLESSSYRLHTGRVGVLAEVNLFHCAISIQTSRSCANGEKSR